MSSVRFEMKCFVYKFVKYCVRTKTNKNICMPKVTMWQATTTTTSQKQVNRIWKLLFKCASRVCTYKVTITTRAHEMKSSNDGLEN